jgi:hypothetical protein
LAEYDSPWKELLEQAFELFVAFFFPKLHKEIDWSVGYESLDTELRKLLPEAAVGKRISDALVKASTKETAGGGRDLRYVHVEVQCQVEDNFTNRLDDYNHLFKLRYNHPIITVVLLGDPDPDWCPTQYLFECAGYRKEITFPAAKLLDYRGREEELEKDESPVALLVLAHLLTLTTRRDDEARRDGKLRLLKVLMDRKMDVEIATRFSRLIDWMVDLPVEWQRQLWQELHQHAKEDRMPFLSYPEQIGYDKGYGKGYDKGKEEGAKEAKRSVLLQGIALGLKLKFKSEAAPLLPAIEAQQDLTVLQAIFDAIEPAASLDDIRRLLPEQQ